MKKINRRRFIELLSGLGLTLGTGYLIKETNNVQKSNQVPEIEVNEGEISQLEIGRRYLISRGSLDTIYFTGILSDIDIENKVLTLRDGNANQVYGWMGWTGGARVVEIPFENKEIPFETIRKIYQIE